MLDFAESITKIVFYLQVTPPEVPTNNLPLQVLIVALTVVDFVDQKSLLIVLSKNFL